MVLRKEPDQILGQHLQSEIGSPHDYYINLKNESFPENDLTIPEDSEVVNLEDSFSNIAVSRQVSKQKPNPRQSEDRTRIQSPPEVPYAPSIEDQYLPIDALNQFSQDFVIKARVMKKGPLKNWSNARG